MMNGQLAAPAADRALLKEQAYDQIKARIQDGTFAVAAFLSERQLASMLGMSKTPVKAAIERLVQEGFVAVSPQQGIVVRDLSLKEIADQFELRRALEVFVVSAIAGKLTEQNLARLEMNLEQQFAAIENQQVAPFVELDAEFHLMICEMFGNEAIVDCLAQHRSKMHRVIYQVTSQAPGRLADAVAEHQRIFEAIEAGDATRAGRLVESHLEFGKQYLLSSKWT